MADKHYDAVKAHPWTERDSQGNHFQSHHGMTLRDYFAGQAVSSILGGIIASGARLDATPPLDVAVAAYITADAMLEAREK